MKKIIFLSIVLMLNSFLLKSQITVVTDDSTYTPNSSNALFEVHTQNGDKGILISRLTTAQRTAITTGITDQSLLVYDTDTKTFWYFDGIAWVEIATGGTVSDNQQLTLSNDTLYIENGNWIYLGGYLDNTDNQTLSLGGTTLSISGGNSVDLSSFGNDWKLTGNAGTIVGTNFLGTTDNVSLSFKTNNTERMRILNTGYVGIGTTVPTTTLHINGTFRLVDGTQGLNKVLTSDANGIGSWQTPPVQPVIYSETTAPYGSDNILKTITVTTNNAADKVLLLGEFDFAKDGTQSYVSLGIWRGGTEIAETSVLASSDADNTAFVQWVDVPGLGTFTYTVRERAGAGGYSLQYGSMLTAVVYK